MSLKNFKNTQIKIDSEEIKNICFDSEKILKSNLNLIDEK